MPNWKKIALSGSNPEFSSLDVDNSVSAGSLTGSIDFNNLTNSPTLLSSSAQIVANLVNQDVDLGTGDLTVTDLTIDNDIVATNFSGSFLRLDENGTGLRMTNVGAFDNSSGNFRIFSTNDLILATNGDSGTAVTIDQTSKHANFTGAISASAFTGSFTGDGSGLSNVTVSEVATVSDAFTSVTSSTVTHNFGTKNVIVQVFDNSDNIIIPQSITTSTTSSVDIVFDSVTTGRVVVAKGGHIVSGGSYRETVSGSSSYTLTHNLNEDYPLVQSYVSASREQIIPKKIKSNSANEVLVEFDLTFSGTIIVKK